MQERISSYFASLSRQIQAVLPGVDVQRLLVGIIGTVVASIALFILIRTNKRLFAGMRNKVLAWQGTRIRILRFQRQELLSVQDITAILTGIFKALHILVLLLLVYMYIHFVFSLFPVTQGLAAQLLGYVLAAFNLVVLAIIDYLPNLVFIIIILFVATYFVKFARLIFNGISSGRIALPGFYQEWSKPTFNIVRFLIIAFAAVVIFPYLPGSGSTAFQGISIFFGVLLSLGSTAAVANVVGGIVITYMRAFEIGDRVKIADTVGDVVEKTLFVTRVKTIKNVDITIPNAMVLANHIINFTSLSKEPGLILHTGVTIGHDVPWRKVHNLLVAAAKSTNKTEQKPAPFVLQTSLDDFYVAYEINVYTKFPHEMANIYSELHQNIQNCFHEAGVEITSPHFSSLRDGSETTIPDEHLPKDYRTPAFGKHPLEHLVNPTDKK